MAIVVLKPIWFMREKSENKDNVKSVTEKGKLNTWKRDKNTRTTK